MQKLTLYFWNSIWFLYVAAKTLRFQFAKSRVRTTQAKVLKNILKKNVHTEFGKRHDFKGINDVDDFRLHVPIRTYDEFASSLEKMVSGNDRVLTWEDVEMFGVSSGSTSASKIIPYTNGLIEEFREGINAWLYFLFDQFPDAMSGKSYWSITPVGQERKYSATGKVIGFDDERIYFDSFSRFILSKILIIPPELSRIKDIDSFRYVTLLFLLREKTLSWISIWNPTFAILFLEPLRENMTSLIRDIRHGTLSVNLEDKEVQKSLQSKLSKGEERACELEEIFLKNDTNFYQEIWPNLKLISCWAHGEAGSAVEKLKLYFPQATIQPKGLVATEAFISFPFKKGLSALSVTSHFFEFEETESKYVFQAHELVQGFSYSVIVTTSGGFYRYRLHDVIRVDGFESQCPLISFVGKQDKVVDMCGEKLNEEFVKNAVEETLAALGIQSTFWMMAPQESKATAIFYTLYIQCDAVKDQMLKRLAELVEVSLRKNYHYNYCRQLRQLIECQVFLIEPSSAPDQSYLKTSNELGQRLGDIKPAKLHAYRYWAGKFEGRIIM